MLHQRAPRPLLGKVLMMFLLPALLLGTFTSAQRLKSSPAAALSSEEEPVQQELGMIQWPQNLNAVRYEVEIFPADKTSPDLKSRHPRRCTGMSRCLPATCFCRSSNLPRSGSRTFPFVAGPGL